MKKSFLILCALFFGAWIHGYGGTAYYVDAVSGSDSNPGTLAQPWQTITKVNSSSYFPNDKIFFKGGQSFTGAIVASSAGTCNSQITYGSYGTGQATISSSTSSGFSSTNQSGILVTNLIFTGGGNLTTTVPGIVFNNSTSSKFSCIGATDLTVSGYGASGITATASSTAGYDNINFSSNTVHDVTGNFVGPRPGSTGCIYIGLTTTGTEALNVHSNVTANHNTVYNCIGTAGGTISTGNGIMLQDTATGSISYNTVHDYGANDNVSGSEAGGIWAVNSSSITISFNEVYSGTGDGVDFDGGVQNSIAEYNWVHGISMTGLLACSFVGQKQNWNNNIYRYNITQTNGFEFSACLSANDMHIDFFNNTLYNGSSGTIIRFIGSHDLTGEFSNNIFVAGNVGGNTITLPTVTATFTGNNYFGESGYHGTFWNWGGVGYSTYSSWQTATGQEKIGGINVGFNTDPELNNPGGGGVTGGYNPSSLTAYQYGVSSPMIGVGINVSSQYSVSPGSQDYYGTPIPTSHGSGFDVGAYAFP